jgi:hypothetical protein
VIGLYLNPPQKAVVPCVDEKSQIQALNRTAPILPLRPGLPRAYPRRELHVVLDNYHTPNPRRDQRLADEAPADHAALHPNFRVLAEPGRGLLRHHHQAGAIRTFIEGWNERCQPFIWTRTADQILPHATREPNSDAGY